MAPVDEDGGAHATLAAGACDNPAPTARAYNCSSTVDYPQNVPAVHKEPPWLAAGLPTFQRVVGADKVVQTQATLGYDDVSEFVNRYDGLYVTLGVQDTELDDNGNPRPITGGRGMAMNHNLYADDDTLVTGVRLHCNVAYDHLTGALAPLHDRTAPASTGRQFESAGGRSDWPQPGH